MDSFNKIISFVLGLVVVIVFFAVVTGKINLKTGFPKLAPKKTTTPTATLSPTPISKITVNEKTNETLSYGKYENSQKTASIPETGISSLFLPALLSGAVFGSFLKNKR